MINEDGHSVNVSDNMQLMWACCNRPSVNGEKILHKLAITVERLTNDDIEAWLF